MDILEKTIQALSKKEIINYKLYTNRKKDEANRKDVALFDLLKKTTDNDTNKNNLISKLYPESNNRNTFNKLKTRLLDEIDNSIVQFYFHETDPHFIHSELSLYHVFIAKNEWEIAQYHLQKAEKKALAINNYLLLEIIYSEFVVLTSKFGKHSPEFYITKRIANNQKLKEIQLLEDAISTVVFELSRNQTFGKTSDKTLLLLNQTIKRINQKKQLKNNVLFKSKIYSAISQVLISKRDFNTLEIFSIKTFQEFQLKKFFSKSNHEVKLQLLRYICNSLFINKKYQLALQYISKFHAAMKEFNQLYYDANVFFYYNALANNYSVLDAHKTIEVLNEAKNIPAITKHPSYLGYVYLNLAGAYFDLKQPKLGLKNMINLYHHPVFETLGNGFKLQIAIIDLLLRIEAGDMNFAAKQLVELMKTHKKTLLSKEHQTDNAFIVLLNKLFTKHQFKTNTNVSKLVNTFCEKTKNSKGSNIVDYNLWLSERFLN